MLLKSTRRLEKGRQEGRESHKFLFLARKANVEVGPA